MPESCVANDGSWIQRDPAIPPTEHVATGHAEGGRVCVVREGGKRAACGGKIRGGFVVIEDDL